MLRSIADDIRDVKDTLDKIFGAAQENQASGDTLVCIIRAQSELGRTLSSMENDARAIDRGETP